jgi:hypothetical protein
LQWLKNEIHEMDEMTKDRQQKLEWTGDPRYQTAIDNSSRASAEYQAEKNTIEQFNSSAGALWACSGFQMDHLCDWSLSLAPNRSISNTLPPIKHSSLAGHRYGPFDAKIREVSMKNVKSGSLVWKKGRTTGITVGIVNSIRTDITLHNSRGEELHFTTWEITPNPANTPFVEAGDSGAWVLDMDGNWCGMVYAQLELGRAAMLDVNTLAADIQRMTGYEVEMP